MSRKFFLLIVMSFAFAACGGKGASDKKCVIEGSISGLDGQEWVYVVDAWDENRVIDSIQHNNGVFRFEVYAVSCDDNLEGYFPEWKSYELDGIPCSILIDCSTGIIVGRDMIGDMIGNKLEELL